MNGKGWVSRLTARSLIVLIALGVDGMAHAQQATPNTATANAAAPPGAQAETRESSSNQPGQPYPDAPVAQSPGDGAQQAQQPSGGETQPLGTAAAPYTRPTGVTGSKPAGAVIAPAKQRRTRAILISVGVIAAAGVAIGTVAGLSRGSPSRPLGAN